MAASAFDVENNAPADLITIPEALEITIAPSTSVDEVLQPVIRAQEEDNGTFVSYKSD